MSKAILVLDMPESCDKCLALDDSGDYPFCLITQEQRGYNFRTREQKMDKCPLKEVPKKKRYDVDALRARYSIGWNSCLKEILGE